MWISLTHYIPVATYQSQCYNLLTRDIFRDVYNIRYDRITSKELPDLELGDETIKLFINPYGKRDELTEDMEAFLKYLTGEKSQDNELVREIEDEVNAARDQKEWRAEYMTLFLRDQENYRAGKAEGRTEERAETILELLGDCGEVSESLKEVIYAQTDLEVLKKWFRLAAKVSSVEEFEQKIVMVMKE